MRGWVGADGIQKMVKDEKRRKLCRIALLEVTESDTPFVDESLRLVGSVRGVHKLEKIGKARFIRPGCEGTVEVGVRGTCVVRVQNVNSDCLVNSSVE